ncbi:ankyrin repeat domain-containing protein [Comamonas sp. MYb69]|uniref:ankyrin repeat domain-containing protein n=1 Tax=Comamonas sp. MYb69 TaxID=1848650 RepID=UPI0030B11FFE
MPQLASGTPIDTSAGAGNQAAARGDIRTLAALAEAGDDLSALWNIRTPLIEAVIAQQAEAVRWLLARGVALNTPDAVMGWTALGWAASGNEAALVQALLAAGADTEHQADEHGRTPLMTAAQAGGDEAVTLLLAAAAQVAAQDGLGATAADLARRNGFEALAARLDALLPPALRAAAPAPPSGTLPWPEELLAVLHWPDDFPTFQQPNWRSLASGEDSSFDSAFHAALADRLSPAFASPTAALRSWVHAMNHWERAASQAIAGARGAEAHQDMGVMWQQLAGAMALRQAYATPRPRKYPRISISAKPDLPLHLDLLALEWPSADQCTITTQHRMLPVDEPESADTYAGATTRGEFFSNRWPIVESRFTLLRKAGQWRIDRWQQRYQGSSTWDSQVL